MSICNESEADDLRVNILETFAEVQKTIADVITII